jgi:hypothetical protein
VQKIQPTVGRVVLVRNAHLMDPSFQPYNRALMLPTGVALAATICYVHSEKLVNLQVSDVNGVPFGLTSVELEQQELDRADPDADAHRCYCHWMPYQLGQAARTEAAEKIAGAERDAKPTPAANPVFSRVAREGDGPVGEYTEGSKPVGAASPDNARSEKQT